MTKNIVITGEGIVSAIGMNKDSTYNCLRNNVSGIGAIKYLNTEHKELPVGEVDMSDNDMKVAVGIEADRVISRTALMGIMAVRDALTDAGIAKRIEKANGSLRILLISGTTVGGMDITEQYYSDILQSDKHLGCLKEHDCGSNTKIIADHFKLFTDFTTISTACSSALNAIILGCNLIKDGQADIVVAGGTEALTKFHLNGFNSLMILDKERCRPFDATRAGLNLGEGAGFVVLESEEFAKERNAEIHSYVTGYGNACDAFHQTASSENGEGAYLAMREALNMANLNASDIQYINAHGTGTVNNDNSEGKAIQRIFGDSLPQISSTKAFTGHTTSASGGIETIISILALRNHFVPANLGWKNAIDDGIVPSMGKETYDIHNVICNAFGFGGNDSSLIISDAPASITSDCDEHESENDANNIKVLSRVELTSEDQLQDIKKFLKPLEVRRMGKLMKSSLLSSLQALQLAGIETPDAIITGTAFGCLENSELLLKQITANGEQLLKPTYFMQSTHNTISSNIAIRTKCHGYNTTYTQGEKSLEWAIRDAKLLLKNGKVKNVLVGCHDETTEEYNSFLKRLGYGESKSINSIAMVLSC